MACHPGNNIPAMATRESPPTDPDRGILERVAGGDTESFAVLVERHQGRLVRLCQRLLHSHGEAEEVTQEVFLEAFRRASSFKPHGKVYTWLYRIAVNRCLKRLRRRRIVRFLGFGELESSDAEDGRLFEPVDMDAPDAEARLEARRRWQTTRQHIEALPAGQRAVLILAKLEGLSYREIAETLDITEGAVESRLFRAMRTLTRRKGPTP